MMRPGMEEADEGHQSAADKMVARFSSQAHLVDDEGNSFNAGKATAMPFRKVFSLPGVIPVSIVCHHATTNFSTNIS